MNRALIVLGIVFSTIAAILGLYLLLNQILTMYWTVVFLGTLIVSNGLLIAGVLMTPTSSDSNQE